MTFENVKYNTNQGKYKCESTTRNTYSEYHIFDENKSVKWNKEEVIRLNREIFEHNKAVRQEKANARELFDTDLCKAAMEEYGVNEAQFYALYRHTLDTYTEHPYICINLIDDVEEIVDFFSTVINMR